MKTYISLLRGINVGSHKRVKMETLQKIYEKLGFINIRIYLQSGNILFQTQETQPLLLEQLIHDKIESELEFQVPIFVMDITYLKTLIESNPFPVHTNINLFHVTLFATIPLSKNVEKINSSTFLPDEFIIIKQLAYLSCANGYGKTKLTNNFFESKLKTTATTRNWKTVLKLYEMSIEATI